MGPTRTRTGAHTRPDVPWPWWLEPLGDEPGNGTIAAMLAQKNVHDRLYSGGILGGWLHKNFHHMISCRRRFGCPRSENCKYVVGTTPIYVGSIPSASNSGKWRFIGIHAGYNPVILIIDPKFLGRNCCKRSWKMLIDGGQPVPKIFQYLQFT